jgi:hypothetical protein
MWMQLTAELAIASLTGMILIATNIKAVAKQKKWYFLRL